MKLGTIVYQRRGDFLEVKHKNGDDVLDTQIFNIDTDSGRRKLYEYVTKKLSINFRKYSKEEEDIYY